jgi:hypothetical protein
MEYLHFCAVFVILVVKRGGDVKTCCRHEKVLIAVEAV